MGANDKRLPFWRRDFFTSKGNYQSSEHISYKIQLPAQELQSYLLDDYYMESEKLACPTPCKRDLERLMKDGEYRIYLEKANSILETFLSEKSMQYPSTESGSCQATYESPQSILVDEPFCEGYQFKLGVDSQTFNLLHSLPYLNVANFS